MSKNPDDTNKTPDHIRDRIRSVPAWYHRIEVAPGIVTPGINDSRAVLAELDLPSRCAGLRVLDLGARDGFFSFELERRGADVLAVDYLRADQTGFKVASELLASKVTYIQDNVYNLTAAKYGTFDIVLMLGLIYHLPDPLGALHIVRSLCRDRLYLETQVIDQAFLLPGGQMVPLASLARELESVPLMQFYPDASLNEDNTNYWAPNLACMMAMLNEANFSVQSQRALGARATFDCQVTHDRRREYFMGIARGLRTPA